MAGLGHGTSTYRSIKGINTESGDVSSETGLPEAGVVKERFQEEPEAGERHPVTFSKGLAGRLTSPCLGRDHSPSEGRNGVSVIVMTLPGL